MVAGDHRALYPGQMLQPLGFAQNELFFPPQIPEIQIRRPKGRRPPALGAYIPACKICSSSSSAICAGSNRRIARRCIIAFITSFSFISDNLLPALWICCIKISILSACNRRASAAERQQLTLGAFLKFRIIPIRFHLSNPHIGNPVRKNICHMAVLHAAAGVEITVRENGQMAVSAVAAADRLHPKDERDCPES